jgi:hypothetical protein
VNAVTGIHQDWLGEADCFTELLELGQPYVLVKVAFNLSFLEFGTPSVGPQSMSIHSARKYLALLCVRSSASPNLAQPK